MEGPPRDLPQTLKQTILRKQQDQLTHVCRADSHLKLLGSSFQDSIAMSHLSRMVV
jgi:hypothetical protein